MRATTELFIVFMTWASIAAGQERWSARFTVRTVDEEGRPLAGIQIAAGLGSETFNGETDTNGYFDVASTNGMSRECGFFARKTSFYESHVRCDFATVENGRCLPWNPVVTAIVRRVINPVPMYAKNADTKIPATNSPCGYDLMVGDWVQPLGKGLFSDFVFTIKGYWKDFRNNDSTLILSFTNSKDGLIPVDFPMDHGRPLGSEFFMSRVAPADGFQFDLKSRRSRTPGDAKSMDIVIDDIKDGHGYLFRIRSVTNAVGIVTNALYGKVSSDFSFGGAGAKGCFLKFTYYLNPTPNDRNLEFDPKKNLFNNLKGLERVTQP